MVLSQKSLIALFFTVIFLSSNAYANDIHKQTKTTHQIDAKPSFSSKPYYSTRIVVASNIKRKLRGFSGRRG